MNSTTRALPDRQHKLCPCRGLNGIRNESAGAMTLHDVDIQRHDTRLAASLWGNR